MEPAGRTVGEPAGQAGLPFFPTTATPCLAAASLQPFDRAASTGFLSGENASTAAAMGFPDLSAAAASASNRVAAARALSVGEISAGQMDGGIPLSDLVTEMKEIKHYFKKGVKARTGIEK